MKGWTAIEEETQLLKRQGETLLPAAANEFRQGSRVTAWFEGAVLQSYPVQGGAEVIVLEEE